MANQKTSKPPKTAEDLIDKAYDLLRSRYGPHDEKTQAWINEVISKIEELRKAP